VARRRLADDELSPARGPGAPSSGEKVVVPVSVIHEIGIVAACMRDTGVLDSLLRKLAPDQFFRREHREVWTALGEVRRRGLAVDHASVTAIGGDHVADYLASVVAASEPTSNLGWSLDCLLWDNARAAVARGPAQSFLDALADQRADPEKVRSFARQIVAALEGNVPRRFIHDPRELVRRQMLEIEERIAGRAHYPYGIPGLDYFDPDRRDRKRMIPGTAPGLFTCLTSATGNGKSTCAARMAIGIAFPGGVESDEPGRRVGYGAWEMKGGMTLEVMAAMSLGWSRKDLLDPRGAHARGREAPTMTHEGRVLLEDRMHRLGERIRFLAHPFRRAVGDKSSNERNLDVLHGLLSDLGCDVFFADLWRRVLASGRDRQPDGEEDALERQQAMNEELRIHLVALHQQNIEKLAARADKRPTQDTIKGSKMWAEAPDAVLGFFRPGLYKRVPDDCLQALVLKQRFSDAPLAVEFRWDADLGSIEGGADIPYDQIGEESSFDADFNSVRGGPGSRRRRAE
jgi:replicative DNA helicase